MPLIEMNLNKSNHISDNGVKSFALGIPKRRIYMFFYRNLVLEVLSDFLLFSEAPTNSLNSELNFK